MHLRSILVVVVAVIAAACTGEGSSVDTTTTAADTTTTTADTTTTTADTTTTTAETTSTIPSDDRLVVGTVGGDVRIYGSGLEQRMSIASGETADFRQPVWLDGTGVLFAEATSTRDSALVAADATSGDERWRAPMSTLPFYYLPSPEGGAAATTSLRNRPDGGGLLAELVDRDGSAIPLAEAVPFYTSWSPDGSALAIHAGGSELSVRAGGEEQLITAPTGVFQAPAWIEAGLVTLRTVEDEQRLSVWTEAGGFRDLAAIEGPVRFVARGTKVAIQSAAVSDGGGVQAQFRTQTIPSIPGGRLAVVDIETGAIETVSDVLSAVYQWDPTGTRLLYATFDDGSTLNFTWHVWGPDGIVDLSSFLAQASWFRDLVPFFDQYDQSVSIWSASGDRIAYPAVDDRGLVVVVERVDGSGSEVIEGGVWASWSRSR